MSEFFLSLFGVAFIFVGIKSIKKSLHVQKNGIRTTGTVISTRAVSLTNNEANDVGPIRRNYSSTVKFITKDKQTLEVELGDAGAEDAIGSKRKIIYDAQFPEEVQADNVFSMVIGPWLALACGLACFIWGILEMLDVINVLK